MYMVGVFVDEYPADRHLSQLARDFKYGCVLTSPRQYRTPERETITEITLADGRE